MHFHEWEEEGLKATLQLKGGGCENVSTQYDLPNTELNAGRDLEGVRRVVLDAVNKAQGFGCAPGVLGIALGGDRGASYIKSKQQLLRPLDDTNPEPELAATRRTPDRTRANELGIGPMGFGGKDNRDGRKDRDAAPLTRVLFRLDCLYVLGQPPRQSCVSSGRRSPMRKLTVPISEETIRALQVGETVSLNGVIATGRDAAHKYMIDNFVKTHGQPPEAEKALIRRTQKDSDQRRDLSLRASRAKTEREMGLHRRRADDQHPRGTVSGRRDRAFQPAGGDRQGRHGRANAARLPGVRRGLSARHRRRGHADRPEREGSASRSTKWSSACRRRFWIIRVEDFPAVVTMDSHGHSLHEQILEHSSAKLAELIGAH